MLAKLLSVFGVAGKVGAVMVGGAYTTEFLKAGLRMATPELGMVVSGPLDTLNTILDPLDLAGIRAKKQREEEAQLAASRAEAKKETEARKRAEKAAKKAEDEAKRARDRAEKSAKEAAAAKARGDEALAREKANRAEQQRRWSNLAARTAAAARTATGTKSEALAAAALDLAKTALNPPKGPQEMLSSEMSDAAKSLLTDIADTIIRKGTEPNYDAIVERMMMGSDGGYSRPADEAGFELDGVVAGHDHDGQEDEDTSDGEPAEVSGPCCASCGLTGSTCGAKKGPVPDYFLFGPPVSGGPFGGDDDDAAEPNLFFDPHSDDENWLVSGPDDGSVFGG